MRQRFDTVVLALAGIRGLSAREQQAVVELVKLRPAALDLSWPDFDRWQAFFTACENFPARWEGLHLAPPPRTPEAEAYQHRKLDLLLEWLETLVHRSNALAHYARQGVKARIARQQAGPACPVCDRFDEREVGLDHDAMPPFHPGCRCVLVAAAPMAPSARRVRAHERPRSRAG